MTQQRNRRAGVEDRWRKTVRHSDGTSVQVSSAQDGKGKRWRARYVDDHGREHAKGFARKIDATQWVDEAITGMVSGTYVDPKAGRITFARFYRDWAERQVWVAGTTRAMDLAAGSVTFGTVAIGVIRRSHVEHWVKAMQITDRRNDAGDRPIKGLAPGTIATRFGNVRAVFAGAVRDRLIFSNPTDEVRLPRRRKAEAAMEIPTVGQVGAILQATDDRWRVFVALRAFAGLRLGEAAALKVGDIDFLRRESRIARQVQRANGGEVEIRSPKYGSERTVYLPDDLVAMLAEHVREHSPGSDPGRWLFYVPGGQPPHQNTVGYWWRQARAAAGFPGVRLHDLRHFFASGLIAAGCDVVTVQRALGHATANVTLSTYSHLWPKAEDRTRFAAQGLMTSATADVLRTLGAN